MTLNISMYAQMSEKGSDIIFLYFLHVSLSASWGYTVD